MATFSSASLAIQSTTTEVALIPQDSSSSSSISKESIVPLENISSSVSFIALGCITLASVYSFILSTKLGIDAWSIVQRSASMHTLFAFPSLLQKSVTCSIGSLSTLLVLYCFHQEGESDEESLKSLSLDNRDVLLVRVGAIMIGIIVGTSMGFIMGHLCKQDFFSTRFLAKGVLVTFGIPLCLFATFITGWVLETSILSIGNDSKSKKPLWGFCPPCSLFSQHIALEPPSSKVV